MPSTCSILSIAPYRLLPATGGGHLGILDMHHNIGKLCPDHLVSTNNNGPADKYAFDMHAVLSASAQRYIPFYSYTTILGIAKRYDCTAIFCDHPYMALTAMMVAHKLGIPWFLRNHNIESVRFKTLGKKWWPLMYQFEKFAVKKADGNFFVTGEDAQWAINNYGVQAARCHVLPFGTNLSTAPAMRPGIKEQLAKVFNVSPNKPWLYFLGALDYAPNEQAVVYILDEVMPRLDRAGKEYQILIAGKGLKDALQTRIVNSKNILYTGFLDSIDDFLTACDIMLNPVITGGGIKTKAVEALAFSKQVVSCQSGAAGLVRNVCGNNLHISADYDWDAFTSDTLEAMTQHSPTPQSFYDVYYWGNIARKAVEIMAHPIN